MMKIDSKLKMSDRSIDDDDISDGGELDVVTVSNEDIEANQRSPSLDKNDGSDSETFRQRTERMFSLRQVSKFI